MAEERLKIWEVLFRRALDILDSAHRAGSMAREWSFGGGTVLMRRHRHRLSTDIDIFIADPQLLGHLSPRLNPVAEAIAPDFVEQANFLKLYFPEGEIDFVVSGPLTDSPVVTERILGRDVRVETSAEIIAKKVWYRGSGLTARDIFDFALVAEREPAAIEQIRPILISRADAVLTRMRDWSEALREDFAALDVLDYRPRFDDCVAVISEALDSSRARGADRAEQTLAGYCISHKVTKSEAVKRALEQMLAATEGNASPYELGREFFERNLRAKPTQDIARHTKRLLIEHFRGRRKLESSP